LIVHLVERIDRFQTQLEPYSFRDGGRLEERDIDALKVVAANDIPTAHPEGSGGRCTERGRVESAARWNVFPRVANNVEEIERFISERIVDTRVGRERLSRLERQISVDLPAFDQTAVVGGAERQPVVKGRCKTVRNVEARNATLRTQVVRVGDAL